MNEFCEESFHGKNRDKNTEPPRQRGRTIDEDCILIGSMGLALSTYIYQ